MIKIGVISPENSLPFIKKGINKSDKYCVEYFIYEKLEETVDIYKKISTNLMFSLQVVNWERHFLREN